MPTAAHEKRHTPPTHFSAAEDCPADRALRRHAALIALRPHVNRFMPRRRGHDRALIRINVIELGPRALLRLAHSHRLARQQLRDLAVALIEISGDDRVLGAYHHAGRLQADFRAMRAEMTFRRGTFIRIDINGIVRTSLHTGLTSDAAFGTEIDDAVFPLVHRRHWADRHARRILAMVAARDLEHAARIGKIPFSTYFTQVRFTVSGT